jgi:hypothetical protein
MCCSSAEALSAHLENDHLGCGKGSYVCRWEHCNREHKPFAQRQKAIRHIRTHTGLKAFKVPAHISIANTSSAKHVENPLQLKKSSPNTNVSTPTLDPTHVPSATKHSPPHLPSSSTRASTREKNRCNVVSAANVSAKVPIYENTSASTPVSANSHVLSTDVERSFYDWIS